jgi:hypothetical protein
MAAIDFLKAGARRTGRFLRGAGKIGYGIARRTVIATPGVAKTVAGVAGHLGHDAGSVVGALTDVDLKANRFGLSKLGMAASLGFLGVGAISEFERKQEKTQMGAVSPGFNPYPGNTYDGQSPSSPYNMGADGKLVFALHNLRHGG